MSSGEVVLMDKKPMETTDQAEVAPFNSVIDHAQRIEGLPNKPGSIGVMPRVLRYFWYFIMGVMGIGLVLLIISAFLR